MRPGPALVLFLAIGTALAPRPAAGQMSASILGVVVDASGAPVPETSVLIRYRGDVAREFEMTTDDNGRFVQLGLQQGPYDLLAAKQGVGFEAIGLRLSVGQRLSVTLRLVPIASDLSDEAPAGFETESIVSAALQAGAAASRAGDHHEAVARFQEAIRAESDCHECHHRLGRAYAQLDEPESAEAALKRAIEIDAAYAPAYRELATLYESQDRAEEAAALRARAEDLTRR